MADTASGPLAGVRVIDLTIWVQGPIASTLLADLGADVIKVERANGGDFSRNLSRLYGVDLRRPNAAPLLWALCNRNKRALALDLHNEAARPVFQRLVESADVLVTNLSSEALRAFGADEETARAVNPCLVYAKATGFGERGPWADAPCQDTVGMAYGGFMFTCSSRDGEPYYPPGAMSDVLSGTMLAFGVLAGLLQRGRTGESQHVTTSQLQSLMWLQSLNVGAAANLGEPLAVSHREEAPNPMFNTYRCADGQWLALGMVVPKEWDQLCDALGLGDIRHDPRFTTVQGRFAHSSALIRLLDEKFATAPARDWLAALRNHGLYVAPVNRAADLVSDEQVAANGYLLRLDDGTSAPAMPFTLRGHSQATTPAPDHGADSDAVLAEAGLDSDEILQLRVGGSVW